MNSRTLKIGFGYVIVIFLLGMGRAVAQPLLPDIIGVTQKGLNIISWNSPYEKLKSIAVQRSADSFFNYTTIGYVKELKKGNQAFIDGHPMVGPNWYRLQIVFSSDLEWKSNRIKLFVDSAQLLEATMVVPNDSLQKLASKVKFTDTVNVVSSAKPETITNATKTVEPTKPVLTLNITEAASSVDALAYIKSQYVFTNPFTGHINVEIQDAREHRYSLRFFDAKDNAVLDLPRIPESAVIIDKRNFQHKGLFKFELYKDKEKLEAGYITIY
jgi:hypothetical protein